MKTFEDFLFLIPARGGSKGIPRKNIKELNRKPLIYYTLDAIKDIALPENICVSTEDAEIIKKVEEYGLTVPFIRPSEIATDTSSSQDVIEHALNYYEQKGRQFKGLVLLQPTSPLRNSNHVIEAIDLFSSSIDIVVSVKETKANPYYVLYEEDKHGFIHKSKKLEITRRQDCPKVWELNGAIYIINIASLRKNKSLSKLKKIRKYVMEEIYSIDIDTPSDWQLLEYYMNIDSKK